MGEIKTDMLTPEQFNSEGLYSNCLGFAIGVPKKIELDYREELYDNNLGISYYDEMDIGKSFTNRLAEYGITVNEVKQMSDLKGKTGFIVYGFFERKDLLGSSFKDDFHVVRINSDGTAVEKPNYFSSPAEIIQILDDKGRTEDFNRPDTPIRIFELVEEKNKDIEKIEQRKRKVLESVEKYVQDKPELVSCANEIKRILNLLDSLDSSSCNIALQQAISLAKEHNIELDFDGR